MASLSTLMPLLFAAAKAEQNPNLLVQLLPFAPIVVLFYFLILRPNHQQEKRRKEMIAALKKNDKVLTSAGIYGTVVAIDNDHNKVVLRVDDDRGVKLSFSRESIVRVVDLTQEKDKEKEKVAESA